MAANYTANYNLCQWEATDQVQRTDFNQDNAKIDAALATLSPLAELVPKLGNCRIYTTSYTGRNDGGSSEKSSMEFPKPPVLMLIFSGDTWFISCPRSGTGMAMDSAGNYLNSCSMQGNTVTWYAQDGEPAHQMNALRGYNVVALMDASV